MRGLVPRIHVFLRFGNAWMAGTRPAMTMNARPDGHSDKVTENCDFSLFPLFFHQIISGRPLVFGGNPRLPHYPGPK
jgi:hypothetical protein